MSEAKAKLLIVDDDKGIQKQLRWSFDDYQVFVAGEHMGGCTEVVEAFEDGALLARFDGAGIAYDEEASIDAWSLMPQWVHPRKTG